VNLKPLLVVLDRFGLPLRVVATAVMIAMAQRSSLALSRQKFAFALAGPDARQSVDGFRHSCCRRSPANFPAKSALLIAPAG
jgi:hypothetical protein